MRQAMVILTFAVTLVASSCGGTSTEEVAVPSPVVPAIVGSSPVAPPTLDPAALLGNLEEFERADHRLESHVDSSMSAYRNGDMEHFRTGYSGGGGFGKPSFFRYDRAHGRMVGVPSVFEAVGTREVGRISPVVLVAGTADSGSWTVAFSVRAGAANQLWVQHWEEPWGEVLQQMWVV